MFSVIFDMDGTLLDTQRITIPAWEYAGLLQGHKGMGSHIKNVCGMNKNGSDGYLKKNFPDIDLEKFKTAARQYIEENGIVTFKKGAEQVIDFLKQNNIKIGLATGTSRPSVMHHLNEVDALDTFDAVVCGTEVENGKPAPDVFLKAAELLGANPSDCFVFEDSENGIRAGHGAGMKCIGIADIVPFGDDVKPLMFKELNDLSEAVEIFKKEITKYL